MKWIVKLITIVVLCFSLFAPYSFAQSPDLQKQIDELKTRIASKVAELNLVEKRALLGVVTDASDTQITIKTISGETRFIDVDELTKFSSSDSSSFGISDIKTSMQIGVIGLYNKESKRTQARLIYQESTLPNFIYGAVYSIDKVSFSVIVAKENGAKNIVDIDTITKTYSYSDSGLQKSGFSKIKEGETVIIVGFFDKLNKNKILALRVLLFPGISASAKINLDKTIPTVPPSTGSGVKLQPITK